MVQVCAKPAQPQAFDQVQASIALVLRQQAWVNALRQYLQLLAGSAEVEACSSMPPTAPWCNSAAKMGYRAVAARCGT